VVNYRKTIENQFAINAQQILTAHGFKNVLRGPETAPYDFTADKDGKPCLIEMKSRSPQATTQFFAFRQSQIINLKRLAETIPVYILLINKYGYKLITIQDFLGLKDGIYTFKCHFEKKTSQSVYYWTPLGWRGTHQKANTRNTRRIHLHLTPEVIVKLEEEAWRLFGSRQQAISMLVENKLREAYKLT